MLSKLLPIFCGALITISIALSSWTMKEVVDLKTRIAALESNRFTSENGLEVWRTIEQLKRDIALNAERINTIPDKGPPAWFIDSIKKTEELNSTRQDKIEAKIDRNYADRQLVVKDLQNKIDALEEKINIIRYQLPQPKK